jgi:dihydrofolate reductase
MNLSLIVAAAKNGVIGRNNQLPWHLPQDLKYFKSVTLGKPIIMGRKTFESIGRPLPGRTNIVVSRQDDWHFEGVLSARNVSEAIKIAREENKNVDEVMVIGGAEIYRHALPLANKIYLTRINDNVEGDAYFAELPQDQWKLASETAGDADAKINHTFLVFERK